MSNPSWWDPSAPFRTKKGKPQTLPQALAPLADTHAHLTSLDAADAGVAIARAACAGVRLLAVPVDPADDVPDVPAFLAWFEHVLEVARERIEEARKAGVAVDTALCGRVRFLAGVHPYGATRFLEDPSVEARLLVLLEHDACAGVGEFGLDFGPWSEVPAQDQEQAFRLQLRIARAAGLPVELHLRDATNDAACAAHAGALRILREEGVPEAGCDLHCFTSGPDVLAPFSDLGCYAAFGGAVTFASSDSIRVAAQACPEELLLSETDCPYMAPVPLRGLRAEPAMVALSAACVARVREEAGIASARRTYEALYANALGFFGLRDA